MSGRPPPPYARSPARRQAFAGDEHPTPALLGPPPLVDASAGRGVCMMSTSWRDKQHPDLVNFIAAFLATNLYRLNFLSLSPDFLFNNGGLSVAFIFETDWLPEREVAVFSRVSTLKKQFKYLYVVVVVRSAEQNESFNQSYFKYGMELGCPTFVPVCDPEMGFEKIVRIAHARGVCRQKNIVTAMRIELAQAIGSIEAIAKASKEFILGNTDLSTEKTERIVRFFRDPQYFLSPKLN
ncbi:protein PARTING DANCERS homolog isoform X2 [Miscanthus floridulus]|uniref:protein PARTING DANCERS homolog isoform X2 n=1 Tax=Miscanthus floridulus TaxID=154761 RepID=UPI003459EE83